MTKARRGDLVVVESISYTTSLYSGHTARQIVEVAEVQSVRKDGKVKTYRTASGTVRTNTADRVSVAPKGMFALPVGDILKLVDAELPSYSATIAEVKAFLRPLAVAR